MVQFFLALSLHSALLPRTSRCRPGNFGPPPLHVLIQFGVFDRQRRRVPVAGYFVDRGKCIGVPIALNAPPTARPCCRSCRLTWPITRRSGGAVVATDDPAVAGDFVAASSTSSRGFSHGQ